MKLENITNESIIGLIWNTSPSRRKTLLIREIDFNGTYSVASSKKDYSTSPFSKRLNSHKEYLEYFMKRNSIYKAYVFPTVEERFKWFENED